MWFKSGLIILVVTACCSVAGAIPRCGDQARKDAFNLLKFHVNNDVRAELADGVTQLPSVANPAKKKQKFDVIEVWGYVYKGQYRMRMIYFYFNDKECVLMGQEILEYASL
jgi:hypothetical protein